MQWQNIQSNTVYFISNTDLFHKMLISKNSKASVSLFKKACLGIKTSCQTNPEE